MLYIKVTTIHKKFEVSFPNKTSFIFSNSNQRNEFLRAVEGIAISDEFKIETNIKNVSFPVGSPRSTQSNLSPHDTVKFLSKINGWDENKYFQKIYELLNLEKLPKQPLKLLDDNFKDDFRYAMGIAAPYELFLCFKKPTGLNKIVQKRLQAATDKKENIIYALLEKQSKRFESNEVFEIL